MDQVDAIGESRVAKLINYFQQMPFTKDEFAKPYDKREADAEPKSDYPLAEDTVETESHVSPVEDDECQEPQSKIQKTNGQPNQTESNQDEDEDLARTGDTRKTSNSPTLELDQQWTIKHKQTVVRRPRYLSRINPSKDCPICLEELRNNYQLRRHLRTDHGRDFSLVPVLDYDQRNHPIDRPVFKVNVQQLPSTAITFLINIENKSSVTMALNSAYIFDGNYQLFPIFTGNQDEQLRMVSGYEFEEEVTFDDLMLAKGRIYSLIISATPIIPDEDFDWFIVEQYHFKEKDDEDEKVKPKKTQLKLEKLYPYELSRSVQALYRTNFKENSKYTEQDRDLLRLIERSKQDKLLTPDSYREQLELLNQFEVKHLLEQFGDYTLTKPNIKRRDGSRCYYISTKQFKKKPSLLCEDGNVLFIAQEGYLTSKVFGTIEEITPKSVTCHMQGLINMRCVTKVIFLLNKTTFQLERNAVALMSTTLIESICFPEVITGGPLEPISSTAWTNPSLADNVEQQTAVRSILNRVSDPLPYILFGPPGTGKTTTIVEAIVQICSHRPTAHILVAAQSNSACDEVAIRLLKHLAPNKLFRVYSRSSEKRLDEIPESLRQVSNLANGKHRWPTWEEVYGTRVVICSLSICGRLVQSKIRSNHFRYVFIDECGSASEPTALVALAGLISSRGKLHASVVLSGDPYQLGPVVRSELAAKMGLGMSMLERLMNLPVYQKDPTTKKYNNQLITKLVKNYRSHEALIKFSNEQFYDGELQCFAPTEEVCLAENWRWLPNKTFPIILHTVFGSNERSSKTKSFMNQTEIDTVEFYLDFLLKAGINDRKIAQEDIGIISPYQLQVQRLKQMCVAKQWPTVEIGSVEQYQGREKLVIILSTARSHTPDVGFLNNVKRLNVALTRAKALLIIVGNSNTLQTDPNWYEFIKYCTTNHAIVGRCFGLDEKRIVERTNRDALFDALFNVLV